MNDNQIQLLIDDINRQDLSEFERECEFWEAYATLTDSVSILFNKIFDVNWLDWQEDKIIRLSYGRIERTRNWFPKGFFDEETEKKIEEAEEYENRINEYLKKMIKEKTENNSLIFCLKPLRKDYILKKYGYIVAKS